MAVVSHKSVISPVVVGRESYLEELERLLEQASQGQGQLALLSGEAGIGKSRLAAEVKRKAGAAGAWVLQGQCDEQDRVVAYAPLLEMLRAHLNDPAAEDVSQRLGPVATTIARLFPELDLPITEAEVSPAPDQEKRLLHHGLTRYLQLLASRRPLLLIIEDLHWCDDATLEFLLYLIRTLPAHPILLLLTYRSDEISAGLGRFIAAVERQRFAVELHLPALTMVQVNMMVRAIFDQAQPVRGDFLQAVTGLTEGNPFFIEEVLKALLAVGDIFYGATAWDRRPVAELRIPRTISDAVQRRAANLSVPAQQLLSLAAVAGRRFDVAVLQVVTHQDDGTLLAALKELVAAQLIVEAETDAFSFRHALTQQALYSNLLGRERQSMHRTLAHAIAQRYAGKLDAHVPELAHHYHAGGAWEEALLFARRAGEQTERLYLPQAAVEHYSRALEAASHLSPAQEGMTLDLASIFRARGLAYETLGDFVHAQADLEKALMLVQANAASQENWQAEWQLLIDLGFLWASRDYERTGEYYRQALALVDRLEEPNLLAHTYNYLGNWQLNQGEIEAAVRTYRQALAIFERLGDRRGRAQTLDMLGMATGQLCDTNCFAYYEEAAAIFRELDDRVGLVNVLSMLGPLRSFFGRLEQVEQDLQAANMELTEAVEVARQIGYQAGEVFALAEYAQVLSWRGDYEPAFIHIERALALAQEIEHHQWLSAGQLTLGGIYLELLALENASVHLQQALALAQEINSQIFILLSKTLLTLTYLEMNEVGLAESLVESVGLDEPVSYYDHFFWIALARLALHRNDPALVLQLLARCRPQFAEQGNWIAITLRLVRGEALAMLGDPIAESVLRSACEIARRTGNRALLWRCQIEFGKYLLSKKRMADAEAEFAQAGALIEGLATALRDEALRANFRQRALNLIPTLDTPTPRQAAKRAFGGLTEAEQQVAALVAQGKSNREIATAQVVSIKTVEAHISHILSKLGFTSRAQIAVWAVEKGLVTPLNGE